MFSFIRTVIELYIPATIGLDIAGRDVGLCLEKHILREALKDRASCFCYKYFGIRSILCLVFPIDARIAARYSMRSC